MVRPTSTPGEKPLFWIGSAKSDLLEFPEAVKDEIGIALSVRSLAGSIRRRSRGGEKALEFWKLWRITEATPTGQCIQ
jgi:hypothetical protein